jgi:chromosome segregation ATPase
MTELLGTLGPILISVTVSLMGAWAISRYAGPAQAAYVTALERRMAIVTAERDEAEKEIPALNARIATLEQEVADLQRKTVDKDREIADLYRRLDADERKIRAATDRARRLHPEGK